MKNKILNSLSQVGQHRKFDSIPKISHKELVDSARTEAHLDTTVDESNLPHVLYKAENTLREFHHREYIKAQEYFHELQAIADKSESNSDIHHIKGKLLDLAHDSKDINLEKEEIEIKQLHKEYVEKNTNFQNFRKYHSRALLPVNSDGSYIQIVVFIALFLIESYINFKMMFSGGAVAKDEALTIGCAQAAINIVSCYIVGKMLIGRLIYSEIKAKVVYSLLFLIHLFVILLLNANMGLFRDAIVKSMQGESLGSTGVIGKWSWAPWTQISSLEVTAVLTIGVGIVLAVISYIDGFLSDDPYPGYGKIYRTLMQIKKGLVARTLALKGKWTAFHDNYRKNVLAVRSSGITSIDTWGKAINDIEQVREDYKKLLEHIETDFRSAVNVFETSYNKYHPDKKITLKKIQLLQKSHFDLETEFNDVKDYFRTDKVRLSEIETKKKKYVAEFDKYEKEVESIIDKKLARIINLGEVK